MHHLAKFGDDPSNHCLDTAILPLSKWRLSVILNLKNPKFFTAELTR